MIEIKKRLVEDYVINPNTQVIMPVEYENNLYSRILETDDEYFSNEKPLDIIKNGCKHYGGNYEGKRLGTKDFAGYSHKAPIEIEKTFSIYMFPTTSPERACCIWIASNHVESFRRKSSTETLVTLRNKNVICLPVSHGTFTSQYGRTSILKSKLEHNIAETRRKYGIL